jgi:hypothetical protein
VFFERCNNVAKIASDFRLKGFAERCSSATEENTKWIESVLSLLSKASSSQWTDNNLESAHDALTSFSKRFFQILSLYNLDHGDDIMAVSLVSDVGGHQNESITNIRIDDTANIDKNLDYIHKALSPLSSDEKIWALNQLLEEEMNKFVKLEEA